MIYLIIILSFFILLLQIEKLSCKKPKFKPWAIAILATVSFVLSVIYEISNKKIESYEQNYGSINGFNEDTNLKIPIISIGGAAFGGGSDFGSLFGIEDIHIWQKGKKLFLSATVRDSSDEIIASINHNEWQVNSSNTFDKNFDDNALEVIDKYNNVVLQADNFNNKVYLSGIFYSKKYHTSLIFHPEYYDDPHLGGGFMTMTNRPDTFRNLIPHIFKYPSKLHMGERVIKH